MFSFAIFIANIAHSFLSRVFFFKSFTAVIFSATTESATISILNVETTAAPLTTIQLPDSSTTEECKFPEKYLNGLNGKEVVKTLWNEIFQKQFLGASKFFIVLKLFRFSDIVYIVFCHRKYRSHLRPIFNFFMSFTVVLLNIQGLLRAQQLKFLSLKQLRFQTRLFNFKIVLRQRKFGGPPTWFETFKKNLECIHRKKFIIIRKDLRILITFDTFFGVLFLPSLNNKLECPISACHFVFFLLQLFRTFSEDGLLSKIGYDVPKKLFRKTTWARWLALG